MPARKPKAARWVMESQPKRAVEAHTVRIEPAMMNRLRDFYRQKTISPINPENSSLVMWALELALESKS